MDRVTLIMAGNDVDLLSMGVATLTVAVERVEDRGVKTVAPIPVHARVPTSVQTCTCVTDPWVSAFVPQVRSFGRCCRLAVRG